MWFKSYCIAIHTLAQKAWADISNTILKIHLLKGCDATSEIETKAVALKVNYHLLAKFAQIRKLNFLAIKKAEKYLCSVLYPKKIAMNLMIYAIFFIQRRRQHYDLYHLPHICRIDIYLDHIIPF